MKRIWIIRTLHQRTPRQSWDSEANRSDFAVLATSAEEALQKFHASGETGHRFWHRIPEHNPENTSHSVKPRVQVFEWPDEEPFRVQLRHLEGPVLDLSAEDARKLVAG